MTADNMLEEHKRTVERQRINIMGKKVVKYPKREIDIPVLFSFLRKELGNPSMEDFTKITGYSESFITRVMNETHDPVELKKAFYLLSLYLANTDKDVPIVGKHYNF